MIRVGIIGSENSHAMAFSKIFNLSGKYEDMRVVAVYGEERAASEAIQRECGVELVCDHPEEMIGRIDALMVTSRDGKLHFPYAKPFLEAGLPAFIDKPVTRDPLQALELVRLAEKRGARLTGGSSVKLVPDTMKLKAAADEQKRLGKLVGGHVWAPVSMQNAYGNFWFYASHLAETALTIFGYHPFAVTAQHTDRGIAAVLDYGAYAVHLTFGDENYNYGATVLGRQVTTSAINIGAGYDIEAENFVRIVRGEEPHQNAHDFIEAVCVMDAVLKAAQSGKAERIVNLA